jgi:hypothetical protein
MPIILTTQKPYQEDLGSRPAEATKARSYLKKENSTQNKAGGVAQVVECLPSKYEALISNPVLKKNCCGF